MNSAGRLSFFLIDFVRWSECKRRKGRSHRNWQRLIDRSLLSAHPEWCSGNTGCINCDPETCDNHTLVSTTPPKPPRCDTPIIVLHGFRDIQTLTVDTHQIAQLVKNHFRCSKTYKNRTERRMLLIFLVVLLSPTSPLSSPPAQSWPHLKQYFTT